MDNYCYTKKKKKSQAVDGQCIKMTQTNYPTVSYQIIKYFKSVFFVYSVGTVYKRYYVPYSYSILPYMTKLAMSKIVLQIFGK